MKIVLLIAVLSICFSCIREDKHEETERDNVTIEQDTTENKIEIDINIKCYGSNQ